MQKLKFRRGDWVKWECHVCKKKFFYQGIVIAIVPPGVPPGLVLKPRYRKKLKRIYKSKFGKPRNHESYLVRITDNVYWPKVGNMVLGEKIHSEFTAVFSKDGRLKYLHTPNGVLKNENPKYRNR